VSVEIHAAIVGGLLSGAVVLAGIVLQHRITIGEDQRRRRQELLATACRRLFTAISNASMAQATGQNGERAEDALASYAAEKAVLLAFGVPEVWSKLAMFDSEPTTATEQGRSALVGVLLGLREAVLPNEPVPDASMIERLVFGSSQ